MSTEKKDGQSAPTNVVTLTAEQLAALKTQIRTEMDAESAAAKEQAERAAATAQRQAMEDAKKDLVDLKLFKDAKDYKDDVRVVVNGEVYTIKRGFNVKVPRFVAEVVENSLQQDQKTSNMITTEEGKYQNLVDKEILS